MLIGTACLFTLRVRQDISRFDRRSSSEPSRMEVHSPSQLRLGWPRRSLKCVKVDSIRSARALASSPPPYTGQLFEIVRFVKRKVAYTNGPKGVSREPFLNMLQAMVKDSQRPGCFRPVSLVSLLGFSVEAVQKFT